MSIQIQYSGLNILVQVLHARLGNEVSIHVWCHNPFLMLSSHPIDRCIASPHRPHRGPQGSCDQPTTSYLLTSPNLVGPQPHPIVLHGPSPIAQSITVRSSVGTHIHGLG